MGWQPWAPNVKRKWNLKRLCYRLEPLRIEDSFPETNVRARAEYHVSLVMLSKAPELKSLRTTCPSGRRSRLFPANDNTTWTNMSKKSQTWYEICFWILNQCFLMLKFGVFLEKYMEKGETLTPKTTAVLVWQFYKYALKRSQIHTYLGAVWQFYKYALRHSHTYLWFAIL